LLSSFPKKSGRTPLLFVHRTFILLRCGKPLAADALLGCFLPRLGPLVATQAASFFDYLPWSLFTAESIMNCLILAARRGTALLLMSRPWFQCLREAGVAGEGGSST
jgi:hypothetical protein